VAVADGRQDELQAEARVDQAEQAPAGEAQTAQQ
jgi:hypothetical protein